jgi:hypothetical protein
MGNRVGRTLPLIVVLLIVTAAAWVIWRQNTVETIAEQEEKDISVRDFQALPYLGHVENDPHREIKGVTLHNERFSSAGVNLLTSIGMGVSHLFDMEGNILHSWSPAESIGDRWLYAEMDRDGNLIAIVIGLGLVKMDWDSDILWISTPSENPYLSKTGARYHHDLEMAESGDIYVLAQEWRTVDMGRRKSSGMLRKRRLRDPGREIRDDSVVILSPEGIAKRGISFYDVIGDLMADDILKQIDENERELRKKGMMKGYTDIFHSNTIEEIGWDIGIAKRGDVLFCLRNLDFIGILDAKKEELKWGWGPGILERPHHPTVLNNGHILIFDNGRPQRGYSRVVELDPVTKEIVWSYEADPRESFYTADMGASQRLPNGNTLITESGKGHVFEVREDGETVWEFWNFEVGKTGKGKGKRATLYRMMRYDDGYLRKPLGDKPTETARS